MNELIFGAAYLAKGIVAGAVIYGIALAILMLTGRRKRGFSKLRCIGEYLFVVYLITVFYITGVANVLQWQMQISTINLVPFVNEEPRLILLNLALFIPMGIFVPLVFPGGKWNLLKIAGVGLGVSLAIELVQLFFAGRLADIDDIIMNAGGTIIGFGIWYLFKEIRKRGSHKRAVGWGSLSFFFSLAAIIWSVPYSRICLGDIVLIQYYLPVWSENTRTVYKMEGFHYTLIFGLLLAIVGWILAQKNKDDWGARQGKIASLIALALIFIIMVAEQF